MTATAPDLRTLEQLATRFEAWARVCYRINSKPPVVRLIPLVVNRAQRLVLDAERAMRRDSRRIRLYVLKGRQGGITTLEQALNLYRIWRRPGSRVMTVSHRQDTTQKIFEITTRAIQHFPPPLLPRLGERVTNEVSFPDTDAKFWTETAGEAGKKLISVTLSRLHLSEFAHYDDPLAVLGNALPSVEADATSVVLETTASTFDSEPHRYWRDTKAGKTPFRALFIPWWQCDLDNYRRPILDDAEVLDTLDAEERELVERQGLDLEQIAWRREMLRAIGEGEFRRQYAEDDESCWLTGGNVFFDVLLLRRLYARAPEPQRIDQDGVQWYVTGEPMRALWPEAHVPGTKPERAILGGDTAEGGGGDRSTFVIRAYPSWKLLCSYGSDRITPRDYARLVARVGRQFGKALLVIEKNGPGIGVLRHLIDDEHYPRDRIYHRVAQDTATGPKDTSTDRIGWLTTGSTHHLLLDAARLLFQAAEEGSAGLPCREVITDAFSVHRDDEGRVELTGRDYLVAESLAWTARSYPVQSSSTFSLRI